MLTLSADVEPIRGLLADGCDLELWGRHVMALISGDAGNIVPMRKPA
jgi:hypothetical protein